jgi:hypothetical protein
MGWARAQMLYDLADGPPLPGSPLESIYLLTAKRRQEAELRKTEALAMAAAAPHLKDGGKLLSDALAEYRNVLMPFLAAGEKSKEADHRALLEHWTEKRAFVVRPLSPYGGDHKKVVSKLRRGVERVRAAENLRRVKPHRRIG